MKNHEIIETEKGWIIKHPHIHILEEKANQCPVCGKNLRAGDYTIVTNIDGTVHGILSSLCDCGAVYLLHDLWEKYKNEIDLDMVDTIEIHEPILVKGHNNHNDTKKEKVKSLYQTSKPLLGRYEPINPRDPKNKRKRSFFS